MQDSTLKKCPICNSVLTISAKNICDGYAETTTYFVIYCRVCGYGPTNAYFTEQDAMGHMQQVQLPRPPAMPNYLHM